jgi:hypothetical protein
MRLGFLMRGMRAPALALALGCASTPRAPEPALRLEAEAALRSGRTASEQRDWRGAARAFGRAALTFGAIEDGAAEAAARRDEAEALRRAGQPVAALAADERALALDRHLGFPEAMAADLAGMARSAAAEGELDRAIEAAQAARPLAPDGTALAALLDNDLALYLVSRGGDVDRAQVRSLLASSRASSEARGDGVGIATSALTLGRAELAFGEPALAEASLQDALARFQTLEDPDGLAHGNELLAQRYFAKGDEQRARFHLAQARIGFTFLEDPAALRRLDTLEGADP